MWSIDNTHGDLLIHTGVSGPAAAMGHRLTLAMRSWRATTQWDADQPVGAELTVQVGSLEVVRGEGGVTPLSGPEKILVGSNALRSLDVRQFPRITFSANTIQSVSDGYRLSGALTIHGKSRAQVVGLSTEDRGDSWILRSQTVLRQSEFGVKPYSQLLGAMKVADDVTVSFSARYANEG